MVYLEAQSCGLPVVAFADGGVPEVVADEVSGYLVRPFDFEGFNQAMARLMDDGALRREMGKAASNYVRRHHDLQSNYGIVEDILLGLARGR
jgi:glycosyltransferase involved in cell wall biosynthesis